MPDSRLVNTAIPMFASIISAKLIDAMFGQTVTYVAAILLIITNVVWVYGSEVIYWIVYWRNGADGKCDGTQWNKTLRFIFVIITMLLIYTLCSIGSLLITRDWALGNLNPWESAS